MVLFANALLLEFKSNSKILVSSSKSISKSVTNLLELDIIIVPVLLIPLTLSVPR